MKKIQLEINFQATRFTRDHHIYKALSLSARASLILIAVFLAACNQDTPTPTETSFPETKVIEVKSTATMTPSPTTTSTPTASPSPTFTPEPVVYGPSDFPSNVNPLTGLIVGDESILDRRPIAVKINIVPRTSNRPPWGLSFADIVYDYYHNDGYTRFHAIFYGNDVDLVGPIRSGRLPDHELIRMYRSIFAYGSADQIVNNRLLNAEYSNRLILEGRRSDCPPTPENPLCRYEPGGYDFLLGGTQAMSEHISSQGIQNDRQNLDGMSFFGIPPDGGVDGQQLFVRYSGDDYVRWDYNPDTGRYLRFQDNVYDTGSGEEYAPLTDRMNDEEQIAVDNVIIVFAQHEYYQRPPNEIIQISLSETGDAFAFRDGKRYEVDWNIQTDSVLFLTFPDGSSYHFKPGTTWIQIVGEFTEEDELENGVWRYEFRIP